MIKGGATSKKCIVGFYRNFSGHLDESTIANTLIHPFSLKKIHKIVLYMNHNKSLGPDGFPIEFYQRFWELIKWDLKKYWMISIMLGWTSLD